MSEIDSRNRPRDPAGTQPKVDPASLVAAPRDRPPSEEAVDGRMEQAIERLEELEHETPGTGTTLPAETEHTPRFQFLFGALLALGAIAIVAAVAVVVGGGSDSKDAASRSATWSSWRPSDVTSIDSLRQIANHVSAEYQLPAASKTRSKAAPEQLAIVTGDALSYNNAPLPVAVPGDAPGSVSLLSGNGVSYQMCGRGPNCTMPGTPTVKRGLVVRREALELALYSLRFLAPVDLVVVFLPPAPGTKNPKRAILFQRSEVVGALGQPLSATLDAPRPPAINGKPAATLVERLTSRMYNSQLQKQSLGSAVLLLTPLVPDAHFSTGTSTSTSAKAP